MFSLNVRKRRCILIAVLLGFTSTICSGAELSEPDLLRLIADGYEDNLSRLRTWTGSAVREASSEGDKPVNYLERLDFILDRDQEAYLWRGNRTRESGESRKQITELNSGMNKEGYTYKMDFLGDRSGNYSKILRGTLLIYSEENFPKGIFTPSFDPIWMLTSKLSMNGGLFKKLRGVADFIENNLIPEGSYEIIREGSKVKIILYRILDKVNVDKNRFTVYVFDLKKGYSLLESHSKDADGELHYVLDYEEHNGVFVPNKITARLVSGEYKIDDTRNITITTKSVNEKIPPSEFQFEKLGLRPGDYILDHSVGGIRYQWKTSDVLEETIDAVLESMISNDGGLVASKSKDEQAPEIDDAEDTKLPAENKVDRRQNPRKSYIAIIAILAAIALCYTISRVLRRKNEK